MVPPPRRAETLKEAYAVLDPARPLEGEWLDRFYAERPPEASLDPLIDELAELDPSEEDKTLFTGHRGSGKTTELARLERALQETHTVVRLNIEELLNLGDVEYTDLLVTLGLQVFRAARRSGMDLGEKRLQDLIFWYRTHILEEDERRRIESEVGGELSVAVAKISVKLATDAPRRQTARAEARAHLSDLLERLNALLERLRQTTGRRTMVIVDGLDKLYDLNQVRDLFCQGANALLEPQCRIVYTIPLALYYTDDFQQARMAFPRTFSLPNIKTEERDGRPCREGREALRRVLENRLHPDLVTPEATERLITLSGGLLKELIALARQAVLRARRLRGDRGPVQADDVEYAARQVRNTYRASLTEAQYRELQRIYRGEPFVNSPVSRTLLHNLSLLEYDGGDAWWAIHPLVRPLVEERSGGVLERA